MTQRINLKLPDELYAELQQKDPDLPDATMVTRAVRFRVGCPEASSDTCPRVARTPAQILSKNLSDIATPLVAGGLSLEDLQQRIKQQRWDISDGAARHIATLCCGPWADIDPAYEINACAAKYRGDGNPEQYIKAWLGRCKAVVTGNGGTKPRAKTKGKGKPKAKAKSNVMTGKVLA